MEFKTYIKKYSDRIQRIEKLFNLKELKVSYDVLSSKVRKTQRELLYFEYNGTDETGIFIFGFDFFIKEFDEQNFKKYLGMNSLNIKIYHAYSHLAKKQKKVKISQILNFIQDKKKDSLDIHKFLRRILTLAYYFKWELEQDKKDLEGDYFLKMPDKFLVKVKQRFNFDMITSVYEDENVFIFLNTRGKLNSVFKEIDQFTKKDVEKYVIPALKNAFGIKKIIT